MGFLGWVMARLEGPHAGGAAIALLLALPSLFSPLFMDEYAQANKWRASSEPSGRSFLKDCFVFAQPSTNERKIRDGIGAWWMRGDGMRLVDRTPPKVGETVVVAAKS